MLFIIFYYFLSFITVKSFSFVCCFSSQTKKREKMLFFFPKKNFSIFTIYQASKHELLSRIPTSTKTFLKFPHWEGFLRNLSCFFSMHPQHFSSSKKTKYALSMKNVSPLSSKNDANANEFNEYFMKFFHSIMIAKLWDDEDDDDGGRWMETLTRRRVFTRE